MSQPRSVPDPAATALPSAPSSPPEQDEAVATGSIRDLPDSALVQVAGFFQQLAEPIRLRVLNLLREQPRCVGELARACGCSAANISRHLAQLQRHGLVHREGRGASVYYRVADPSIYALCDLVCTQLARQQAHIVEAQASFLRA